MYSSYKYLKFKTHLSAIKQLITGYHKIFVTLNPTVFRHLKLKYSVTNYSLFPLRSIS